jgi:hypothetical protein
MSHQTLVRTKITNATDAAEALRDLYPGAELEVDPAGRLAARLYGTQTASGAVAVARAVGIYREDVAAVRLADGSIGLAVDSGTARCYAREHDGRTMPAMLAQRSAYHTLRRAAHAAGLALAYDSTATVDAGRR